MLMRSRTVVSFVVTLRRRFWGPQSQITPDRTYYGIERAFPARHKSRWQRRGAQRQAARRVERGARDGRIGRAGTGRSGGALPFAVETKGRGVLYAQLYTGEEPVGLAVVFPADDLAALRGARSAEREPVDTQPRTFTGYARTSRRTC